MKHRITRWRLALLVRANLFAYRVEVYARRLARKIAIEHDRLYAALVVADEELAEWERELLLSMCNGDSIALRAD